MNRSCHNVSRTPDAAPRVIIRTCRHILDSGALCRAAAYGGRRYCRAHAELRARLWRMARARRRTRVKLPILEDLRAVEIARARVRYALAADHIQPRTARMMFYGLRLAASTLRFMEWQQDELEWREEAGRAALEVSHPGP